MQVYRTFLILAFLFLSLMVSAQVATYDREWKRISDLIEKQNLPKTALEEVNRIYVRAKKEKQEAQVIKALVYKTALQQRTREDNLLQSIKETEKEIAGTKEPSRSVLQSMLAGLYWQLFQQERWKLYGRTTTTNFVQNDPSTWSATDFHGKIGALYLASLKNKKLLQQTSLKNYGPVIRKGNVSHLRPTLYDLLAHRALDYFRNDERDMAKPAYYFEIDQPEAFADASVFASYTFRSNDTVSLKYKALTIYQELLDYQLKSGKLLPLIDADLDRLQFVHQHSVAELKDSLYLNALNRMSERYKKTKEVNRVYYLIAEFLHERSNRPGYDTSRNDRLRAVEILTRVVNDSSLKNEGWTNSYNLLNEIKRRTISFEVEKVNLPQLPFRMLLQYKNLDRVYLKIIAAPNKGVQYEEIKWDQLFAAPAVKTWSQFLPAASDYREHSVELKSDGLQPGRYLMLISDKPIFNKTNTTAAAQYFHVSGISYVNNENDFFVLDRANGRPLKNASVQQFISVYDYQERKYVLKPGARYQTNENGFFRTAEETVEHQRQGYSLHIKLPADSLFISDEWHHPLYRYPSQPVNRYQLFLFTDRAIYRPGQAVYFKGIAINENKEAYVDKEERIFLLNANGVAVDSMDVKTGEFGSFSGRFQLPVTGLTGNFSLVNKARENLETFSVEEYKRPTFSLNFLPVTRVYQPDDSVHMTGNAKAYAGNSIPGAAVAYRVVRETMLPFPWYPWRILPRAKPVEITHGQTTTDANGNFSISFKALPDRSMDTSLNPVFYYRVYADVTDVAGETRTQTASMSVSYNPVLITINMPEKIRMNEWDSTRITTTNVNGAFVRTAITTRITRMLPEQRLIRNRYWERPDRFVMSKEEYLSYFPHDEYNNETQPSSWPKGDVVYQSTDSSATDGKLPFARPALTAGYYEMEVTTVVNGRLVKNIHHFEVINGGNEFAKPVYIWNNTPPSIEPGQSTQIELGTSANDVFLVRQLVKKDSTQSYSFIEMDKGRQQFSFSATEADRGGYGVRHFFVKHNRFHQAVNVIDVPWSNKQLDIGFSSFRDKTLPGAEEKWTVTIKGNSKDKVAAEMLVSMYDASLDQFRPHQWNKPYIWQNFNWPSSWTYNRNFTSVNSFDQSEERPYRSFEKIYDHLMLSLYETYYGGYETQKMRRSEAPGAPVAEGMAQDAMANHQTGSVQSDTTKTSKTEQQKEVAIIPRKNFNETAFFFPQLRTDAAGNISFTFLMPEALTEWKLQALAHTGAMAFGMAEKRVVTQKELMVQPSMPRFLRQGDRIELAGRIVNMSDHELTGQVELQLYNAHTNQRVDGWFNNIFPNQYFTVEAGGTGLVKFPVDVPHAYADPLVYRIVASSGNYSDGEENILPVLSNKILVTETLPLVMRKDGEKTFRFDKLLNTQSESLQHHALTVEYTSNPVWHVVMALPYIIDQKNESSMAAMHRYYANAMGAHIIDQSPSMRSVIDKWLTTDSSALLSNLEKNEELKNILLEETPWVRDAANEKQNKKNIALLMDRQRISRELQSSIEVLRSMQSPNGGFVWFKGGPDDRFITQSILKEIGRLVKIKAIPEINRAELNSIAAKAVAYIDLKMKEDYDYLLKRKLDLKKQPAGPLHVHYLYIRSYFNNIPLAKENRTAYNYFLKQSKEQWMKMNIGAQAMTAITMKRAQEMPAANAIMRSLKESAIIHEELGMYWKNNVFGRSMHWYDAPIETQALMTEAFSEVTNDIKSVDEIKLWLLKNKQTNNWRTSSATADACYAMLVRGSDWIANAPTVSITLGDRQLSTTDIPTETGTGYFKEKIPAEGVRTAMGNIRVSVKNDNKADITPSWGAVYWQYFEQIDKITYAATPLQLKKDLFVQKNTDRGPILQKISEGQSIHVGDKVVVRIELRVDREMDYVHMKDLRAPSLEPVNVLSQYKWKGGMGYYEATRDANTSFFFSHLRRGTYVFEYSLHATHSGIFNNGITTIQSLYAPEFTAHSESGKIRVGEK